jgi:hypothetical protein
MMGYCNRRLLSWSLFALVLVGLAWGLHAMLPPVPRWTEASDCDDAVFSPDGGRVLTVARDAESHAPRGPVCVRDAASGRTLFQFAADLDWILVQQTSTDFGQWVGAGLRAGDRRPQLVTADLTTGATQYTPLEIPGEHGAIGGWNRHYAIPPGLVVIVTGAPDSDRTTVLLRQSTYHLFDARTGGHLASLPSAGIPNFTPDGRYFLHDPETRGGERTFGVWDVQARRGGPPIQAGTHTTQVYLGPDSRTQYVFSEHAHTPCTVTLWDLATGTARAVCKREHPQRLDLSHDGRRFVLTPYSTVLGPLGLHRDDLVASVCDVETGRQLMDVPIGLEADARFSPDGRLLFIVDRSAGLPRVRMFDVEGRRTLWEFEWPDASPWSDTPYVQFVGADGERLIVVNPRTVYIETLDARSGESQGRVRTALPPGQENTGGPPAIRGRYLYNRCHLMPDRRALTIPKSAIRQWLESWLPIGDESPKVCEMVQIVDVPAGREVFRLVLKVDGQSWLSADGTALLVREEVNDAAEIRCYDVPAGRPWRFIFGIPSALGVMLLLVRTGTRCMWRRPRAVAETPASRRVGPGGGGGVR